MRKAKSEAMKGEKNPFFGKHLSVDAKKKISESRKKFVGENHPMFGKHHSDETRQKISDAKIGKSAGEKNPMYGRTGEKNPMYGRTGEKHPMFKWSYEACQEEAAKYRMRSEFAAKCDRAYRAACKNKWLDDFFPRKKRS